MTTLTIFITKLLTRLLRLAHRNAGNVPGRVALKLNPNILKRLKIEGKIIVTTGTNGKTTTNNLLAAVFRKSGKKVIVNSNGNNISWGIATTLLQAANLRGEISADYLLLETDEHWVPVLYANKNLTIDTLIVLDFFRDQLDRAGEMETLVAKLAKFVKSHPCNLVLNGDDPNVIRIGLANQKGHNYYYGLAKLPTSYKISHDKMEGIICPHCKTPLVYDFYQYSHLGHFHCPRCDYANPEIDTLATTVEGATFTANQKEFTTTNENLYCIYNLLAIITVANLYHLDLDIVKHIFAIYKSKNGRHQTFVIDGKKCTLNLCKNPTGFNVILRTLKHNHQPKDLLLVLNDHVNDGYDVSWIWDIDFTDMNEFERIICSGTRAYDMAIPVKCNDYDPQKIIVHHDIDTAIDALLKTNNRKYIISNYSPLMQVQKTLTKLADQSASTAESRDSQITTDSEEDHS